MAAVTSSCMLDCYSCPPWGERKIEFLYGVFMVFIGQGHLGEVVFVELPESGVAVAKGGSFGAVESVKATSDVNSPVSGEVIEINTRLTETPGLVIPAAPPPSSSSIRQLNLCSDSYWKQQLK